MKKQTLLVIISILYLQSYSQNEIKKLNSIGVSMPVIWNNSEAVYYILGNLKMPAGKCVSNGINVNYSRNIHNNFFLVTAVGFFRQRFNIARPFTFTSQNQFGFFTKKYSYDNIQLTGGVGYKKKLIIIIF
jgi:hypothetical protein